MNKELKFEDLEVGKLYKSSLPNGKLGFIFLLLKIDKYDFCDILTKDGISTYKFSEERIYVEI